MYHHFPILLLLLFLLTNVSISRSSPHHHHSDSHFLLRAFKSDSLRHRSTLSLLRSRRSTSRQHANSNSINVLNLTTSAYSSTSFTMTLISGAYAGVGEYFVRFLAGTPAQRFLLVLDTGSDLTWMKCCRGRRCGGAAFSAAASRTFRPIGCASDLCKMSLPSSLTMCPSPASPCFYDYSYSDGSRAQGMFARESSTILLPDGQRTKLNDLVIGCTSSYIGSSFRTADGVLGLGFSETSFAVKAASLFGGKFSYCLVDHLSPKNIMSHLTFGTPTSAESLRYVDLVLDRRLEPFYAVKIHGISVGDEMLKISREVWDLSRDGGAIMDTGTSLTVLATPAYVAVTEALSRVLPGNRRVGMDPFEYCYNWTVGMEVGKLAVHLEGYGGSRMARLEPLVKSYVIDVADGVKCLGFVEGDWPGISTIGNILQQNHRWEFDIGRGILGFAPSTC